MRENIDYRLLERFRTLQRVNAQPPTPQTEQKRVATAANRRQPPALDLRD
jgi:hypothetical protein